MIKEKHEKGSENTSKDEAATSDKETPSTEVRVKKEDDIKKEPTTGPITKNGGIVGSTNTGSVQSTPDRKVELNNDDHPTAPCSEGSTLPLKQEDSIDGDSLSELGLNLGASGGGGSSSSHHPPPPDGVQPLASNVINKQPSSMEVHYMQQQSQIFVFSTMLANSGAEEVQMGRYPSIIAYHCAQPGTKKYLEKNPLKVTQFNRQNPAQWLNNLAMMKNKGCTRSPGLGPKMPPSIDNFLGPEGLDDMVGLSDTDAPWDQKSNHLEGLENAVSNGLPDMGPDMDACSPSMSNIQPKLQGVQVPDENLTPQQRQHREEKLVTMRKLQQMLFPENQGSETGGADGTNMPPGPGPGGPGQPPVSGPSAMEWQKLQHQYFDDRNKMKPGSNPGSNTPVSVAVSGASCGASVVPIGPGSCGATPVGPPVGNPSTTRPGPTGPRLQGPPPPYHQTPRSASVPIALQSPSPASPNNPPLSLPSPRASSDSGRPFGLGRQVSGHSPTSQDSPTAPRISHSNPGTPLSAHHLSPSVTTGDSGGGSAQASATSAQYARSFQNQGGNASQANSIAGATHGSITSMPNTTQSGPREPNLMPVPSPQQIQYLNTFEGQELIIQKQPNTSLKDGSIISPPVLPSTSMESNNYPPSTSQDLPHQTRVSGPNTPTSLGPQFAPTTSVSSDGCRFNIPSPHTPGAGGCAVQSPGNKMGGPQGFNISPQGKPNPLDMPNYCNRAGENVPLNPNCTSTLPGGVGNNPKLQFDPISSLTQMSQQLTNNNGPGPMNGGGGNQGGQGPPMMGFGGSPSMHMMDMGCHGMPPEMEQGMMGMGPCPPSHAHHSLNPHAQTFHPNSGMGGPIRSLSPKLAGPPGFPTNHMPMPPRMMGRLPTGPNPYNGANVQVKPNAPNTIQYLPAKQGGPPNQGPPRGPPSLDFLTRLAAPGGMPMMDKQGMQYFPNCGGGPGPNGPMPPMSMGQMDMVSPNSGPGGMDHMGPPMGAMMGMPRGGAPNPGMRPGMMRMQGPPGPQMTSGPPFSSPQDHGMFNHPQMFVAGPKGSPMQCGVPPDATQPLPPSMGQATGPPGSFKPGCGSPFVGPTTADPNYAQQFHNFQQQLYATNTRSQMPPVAVGPGPPMPPHTVSNHPHMQQPPYFNPK